jgi:Na+/proline symporter
VNGQYTLSTILFLVFVVATLGITFWASRQTKTAADYYAGGRSFTGVQNGLAIGGDYMSAASFLGIAGMIALSGYDGFLYSIGFLVAWLVALLLVAELMRNSGKFTMADVLAFRMSPRPVRTAAGVSTIIVSIFYLLAQMVGAGALVGLLLGITSTAGKNWTIVAVGALMIVYVVFGGMKGTTWVQIVKAVLLMGGAAIITVLVLAKYNFNLSALLGAATEASGKANLLEPGLKYGTEAQGLWGKIDLISLGLALVLGTAGLPHILIRFYTVPTAKDARKSVLWGIGIIGTFYLLTLVLGFGAAALVKIPATDTAGNTAAPQLAAAIGLDFFGDVGGTILLALIGAVAFATILAVVAGLILQLRPRPVRARVQEGHRHRTPGSRRRPGLRLRHRRRLDRPRHPRPGAERGLPGGAGLRGRRLRQPARHPLQPVLEAVQHGRSRLRHLRRSHLLPGSGGLLAGHVRLEDRADQGRRLPPVEPVQPGHLLDPDRLPVRLPRHRAQQGVQRRQVRRDGGALADRCGRREGLRPLTTLPRRGLSPPSRPPTCPLGTGSPVSGGWSPGRGRAG